MKKVADYIDNINNNNNHDISLYSINNSTINNNKDNSSSATTSYNNNPRDIRFANKTIFINILYTSIFNSKAPP